MKKSIRKATAILLTLLLALSLAACQNNGRGSVQSTPAQTQAAAPAAEPDKTPAESTEAATGTDAAEAETDAEAETEADTETDAETGSGKILIAYFSLMETDGTDTVAGASRVAVDGKALGNNQYIAQIIERETGADLFLIETVQEYPTTHEPLLEFARSEKDESTHPELAAHIENPDDYDILFLGYPIWNADLPMPLYTFLEEHDFSGKTIIPFTVHGGSGFSGTIQTISELQPDASVIADGFSVSRNNVSEAESDVIDWVNDLDLTAGEPRQD